MTEAVCFKCGGLKWGAFSDCESCGARPRSDDDLMLSLSFTDHYFDQSGLEQIGSEIAAGRLPQLDEATKEKLRPAVLEAKRILPIGQHKTQPAASASRFLYFFSLLFSFSGRINRAKYWLGIAIAYGLLFCLGYIRIGILRFEQSEWDAALICGTLVGFASVSSLLVRRIHDLNLRGWWLLAGLPLSAGITNLTAAQPVGMRMALTCLVGALPIIALGLIKGTNRDASRTADKIRHGDHVKTAKSLGIALDVSLFEWLPRFGGASLLSMNCKYVPLSCRHSQPRAMARSIQYPLRAACPYRNQCAGS
jgi:uncharacterized membrane protein YhaH (DUF805 family)